MRNLVILAVTIGALFFLISCNGNGSGNDRLPSGIVNNPNSASGEKSNKGTPKITFTETEHDFGKVITGEKVTYSFKFINDGDADLLITKASSSCGCTVPKFTDKPVKPGQKGTIEVTFDSENRKGFQNKTITIVTNAQPSSKVLQIKAMVIDPENK